MAAEAYSLRSLQPFDGLIQVLECDAGRALSLDGRIWQLQVGLELASTPWSAFESPTLTQSFVPYGNWSQEQGMRRLPQHPMADPQVAREHAARILADLQPMLADFPFPPGDPYELWLLDPQDRLPLALLGSSRDRPGPSQRPCSRWKAFPLHQDPLLGAPLSDDQPPLASRVESLVNRRAGASPAVQWFLRQPDGSGLGLHGRHLDSSLQQRLLAPEAFPPNLLREDWPDPEPTRSVARYQERMAPRLLALSGQQTAARRRLEQMAWQQPELVHQLYRQYPVVLDPQGLKITLVKARMMLSSPKQAAPGAQPEPSQDV
jgi:hypothetical protein